jgi:hypothetical protein
MIVDFRLKEPTTKPLLLASVFAMLRRDKLGSFGLKLGLEAYFAFIFAHFLALDWLFSVFFYHFLAFLWNTCIKKGRKRTLLKSEARNSTRRRQGYGG